MRDACLGGVRFYKPLDGLILSCYVSVSLPGFDSEPTLKRGVSTVQNSRSNDLSRSCTHFDWLPAAIPLSFIRRLVLRETARVRKHNTKQDGVGSVANQGRLL